MKYLYLNKYWKINKDYNLDKLLYLMIDRPYCINERYGDFIWKNNINQKHRDYDLPSYIKNYYDIHNNNKIHISLCWIKDGKYYRKANKSVYISYDGFNSFL